MSATTYTIGFAITGSFCTFHTILPVMEQLVRENYRLIPILSESAGQFDTRFTTAQDFRHKVEEIAGRPCMTSIVEAEPIGPKALLDALIIAPCTGNTLAKLANGITDGPVLMAAKAHLRNQRPVLIHLASNDGMGMNFKNIGLLMNTKNIYFVPFGQDNPEKKPNSLVAEPSLVSEALASCLVGKQLQPVLLHR